MKTFKERWIHFSIIIFDPWILCFILSTLLLLFISHSQTDRTASSLLNILILLSSAILGARLSKLWTDITEGGLVVARGKSAVRGLKLLLSSILSLDKRVHHFIDKQNPDQPNDQTALFLNEIRGRCNILAEEAVSSIEKRRGQVSY